MWIVAKDINFSDSKFRLGFYFDLKNWNLSNSEEYQWLMQLVPDFFMTTTKEGIAVLAAQVSVSRLRGIDQQTVKTNVFTIASPEPLWLNEAYNFETFTSHASEHVDVVFRYSHRFGYVSNNLWRTL